MSNAASNLDREIGSTETLFSIVAGLAQVSLAVFGAIQVLGRQTAGPEIPDALTFLLSIATAAFLFMGLVLQARLIRKYREAGSKPLPWLGAMVLGGLILLFATFWGLLYPQGLSEAFGWLSSLFGWLSEVCAWLAGR